MSSTNVPNQRKNGKKDNPTAACETYDIDGKGLNNVKGNWAPTNSLILEGNLEIVTGEVRLGEDGIMYGNDGRPIIKTVGNGYKEVERNRKRRAKAEEPVRKKQDVQLGE